METAPLLLAHSHARAASFEIQKSNATVASKEHELAAGEFARVAENTQDTEALRILKLLEEHHHQLSKIIKSDTRTPPPPPRSGTDQDTGPSDPPEPQKTEAPVAPPVPRPASPDLKAKSPSEALSQRRASRNAPSSIASNLASARGIPSNQRRRPQPVSPALSPNNAEGKISNDPSRQMSPIARRELVQRRLSGRAINEKPSSGNHPGLETPPNPLSADTALAKDGSSNAARQAGDDSFQRFYSNIRERISSLPSYLAFAGLPLSPPPEPANDGASTNHPAKTTPDRTNTSTRNPSEPNVNTLFSRAALRAVKDENGNGFGGAESFYVVPSTGGTVSYAGILGREDSGPGMRLSNGSVEGEGSDEFVDALEKPQPSSPRINRTRDGARIGLGEKGKKTMEELVLENSNLKRGIDILSSRLAQWEVGSQAQSMALRQSVMAGRVGSAGAGEPTGDVADGSAAKAKGKARDDGATTAQNQASQEEKKRLEERISKLERENEKLLSVVVRYRERWEKLKEGARTRRDTGTKTEDVP
ncbi:MAG: hypothetical protein M1822_007697 [Bathelium mastoideum]|nr:MAG: hypothetical protein M1822_007697 [Bathelium mastoideum]